MCIISDATADHAIAPAGYRHEAFFYTGAREFLDGTNAFVEDALRADETVRVALRAEKLDALRAVLGGDAKRVTFVDMEQVGRNPARIIPAWRRFVDEAEGRRVRGIGEPIWADRSPDEMVECQLHEALLNVAFTDADFWLLCPYDASALASDVLAEARRNHAHVVEGGASSPSEQYGPEISVLDAPLAEPLCQPHEVAFDAASLAEVRGAVTTWVSPWLSADRVVELVLAVHEVTANSVRHGGGHGVLRCWEHDGSVVCEVRDGGRIEHAMVGRQLPESDDEVGRGLWLANQLCDLVQVRRFPDGSAVRLHLHIRR
ncbi:MAG TPA: sensor histidine kinase [Acidimicrobiales bacterium]|nr:sensor histidine kinase [Acidimicrobiales bacterium]